MRIFSCRYQFIVFLIFFFNGLLGIMVLRAQEHYSNDALIKQTKEAFDLASDNNKLALKQAQLLLSKGIKQKDELLIANASNSIGWSYFHGSLPDSAVIYLENSKNLFKKLGKKREVIQVSLNLSEVFSRNSFHKKALDHLLEANKLNQKFNDQALQTDLYRQFGIVYRELNSFDLSANYFLKAIDGFKKQKDSHRVVTTGTSLSILYRKLKQFDKAILLLNELEIEHQKSGLSNYLLAMIYENLGEVYYEKNDFKKAKYYFLKAYKQFKNLNLKSDLAYEAINIGRVSKKLNDWEDAEKYLLASFRLSDSLKLLNYAHDASFELSKLYKNKKQWEKAYEYNLIAFTLKDSLNNKTQFLNAQELAKKFDLEKKEQEIELLKTKAELDENKRRKSKFLFILFLVISIFSAVVIWLLWNRIKLNKKLEYEKQQNKITSSIEDERILNQFAVSLFGKNNIEEIFWEVAINCIELLKFEDCVVYLADRQKQVLIQYAAAGPKNPTLQREIFNPIQIPFDKGIVGSVFKSEKAEIVNDTANDKRYLIDDQNRQSEITVPIFLDGKVFGIIDSENSKKDFYTERHLHLLERIASICSVRVTKLMTEENLRHSIARDLHDEVGSTITSISILSKLLLENHKDKNEEYLIKINEQSQNIMECMSDIIWAIHPRHDSFEQTILKMKEFSIEHVELAGMKCKFNTSIIGNQRNLPPEERKFVYMIFKEAVNNAVKHSNATEIEISILQNNEVFQFEVKDNGKGFNAKSSNNGNGIKNMQERAKTIKASLTIDSEQNKGTILIFSKNLSHD